MRSSSGPSVSLRRRTSAAAASSRWLRIRSLAWPAEPPGTLTANSVWSNRTGNTEGASADPTFDSMPCASSRPRTTSASIDECVRKMTTGALDDRSGVTRLDGRAVPHFEHDHRHIVVRLRVADKRLDFAQHALADAGRVELVVARDDLRQRGVAEELPVPVHGLRNAVGVEHDDVTRRNGPGVLFENLLEAVVCARQTQ